MSERSVVPVPWKLLLRRARYQIVPIGTMVMSSVLAGWLWMRHVHTATATGEVSAVRISVESKVDGVLEQLPQPVHVFDTVRDGQLVARVDLKALDKQIQQMKAEVERMRAGATTTTAATQPVELVIAEREARIAEMQSRLDAREIKSPIDGTVMEIHRHPGQSVKQNKTIMEISGDKAEFIIGYLREDAPVRAVPGMQVIVRTRGGATGRKTYETYVKSVGPQVEPMPARHLRNPAVKEWAVPVQIAMPADAELRPGEMVELVFRERE